MKQRPGSLLSDDHLLITSTYLIFSQLWLPTVQDVLHADWQDVWHSPQPPFLALLQRFLVLRVVILFIICISVSLMMQFTVSLYHNKFPLSTVLLDFLSYFNSQISSVLFSR